MRGSTKGICDVCGSSVFLPRVAWNRHTKPTCGRCGAYLHESTPTRNARLGRPKQSKRKEIEPEERSCLICGSRLSVSNCADVCRRHDSSELSKLSCKDSRRVKRQRGVGVI